MGRPLKELIIETEQQGRKTRWIWPQEPYPGISSHLVRCLEQDSMK